MCAHLVELLSSAYVEPQSWSIPELIELQMRHIRTILSNLELLRKNRGETLQNKQMALKRASTYRQAWTAWTALFGSLPMICARTEENILHLSETYRQDVQRFLGNRKDIPQEIWDYDRRDDVHWLLQGDDLWSGFDLWRSTIFRQHYEECHERLMADLQNEKLEKQNFDRNMLVPDSGEDDIE